MSLDYRIGDVFDRLAEIPGGSIDLIVTSPPFLALRSYLPADHPDKGKEIGSEATPAAFLDTLLALTAEWGRVLAPHGSLCVELGDTYADGALGFKNGDKTWRPNSEHDDGRWSGGEKQGPGWPLAKSLTGIPQAYMLSLAYGRNILTGEPSPAGRYRIRNQIVWARPNPTPGALADKFRPATSYITVACRSPKRYFDLDAVRGPGSPNTHARLAAGVDSRPVNGKKLDNPNNNYGSMNEVETAGAPPLDWHSDLEDGDWLWKLPTQPYKGAHYATFPLELPTRLIMAICPLRVCTTCGKPSERITETTQIPTRSTNGRKAYPLRGSMAENFDQRTEASVATLGWSDCGHNTWRTGNVLDPFCGSGTTLQAAQNAGRHAIGIDLDPRNADLAQQRVGMFLEVSP